jgi:hypothetical protein
MQEAGDICVILGHIPQKFAIIEATEAGDSAQMFVNIYSGTQAGKLAAIAPVAFPLKTLLDTLSAQIAPNEFLTPAYDPDLKIESTITQVRAVRAATATVPNVDGNGQPRLMPIFAFKTASLKRGAMGRRGTRFCSIRDPNNDNLQVNFYAVQGQVDVGFSIFHNSLQMLEMYETAYISKARFANVRHMEVTYPDPIGTIPYSITWGDLDDKLTAKSPVEYQAIIGVLRIEGTFIVFDESSNLLINTMVLDLMNWNQAVYGTETFTRVGEGIPVTVTFN